MQFEVTLGEAITFEGDALIVPTISDGTMRDGVANAVRAAVGNEIEAEVVNHAPIAVGAALVTEAPGLSVEKLIHVPLVEKLGMRVGVENIRRATRAGLLGAHHHQLERVGLPGIGYGENGVPYDEAARAIIDEAIAFKQPQPLVVVLVDTDQEMLEAFKQQVGSR